MNRIFRSRLTLAAALALSATAAVSVSVAVATNGEPPADQALLVEVIQRVSQLVGEHHEIQELDINPFVAFEVGGLALDARIRVGPAESAPRGGLRDREREEATSSLLPAG